MVFDGVAYALVEALPATPVAPGWTTVGSIGTAYSGSATSTDGTRIYSSHGNQNGSLPASLRIILADGSATSGTQASTGRQGVAGAFCNGKHYAIGGFRSNGAFGEIEAYTPAGANGASGVWSTLTSSPVPLGYSSAVSVGNSIYMAGGQTTLSGASNAAGYFYRYDTTGNTWATLPQMPAARTQGAMVAYSGKLYYYGGIDSSGTSRSTIYVYDIAAGAWSTYVDLSGVIGGAVTAWVVGSDLYWLANNTKTFYKKSLTAPAEPVTSTFVPTDHGNFPGAATIGSSVYLVSGSATANVDRIDVNASGSFGASVQAVQAVTALAGGAAAGVAFALPTTIPTAPGWATVGIVPETYRYRAAVSSDGTRAYVSHGYHQGTATNEELTFSAFTVTADGSFAMMPSSPTARSGVAGAWCNGKHYAIGGLTSGNIASNTNEAYTPAGSDGASGIWSTVAVLLNGTAYSSAATVGTSIYLAGGQSTPSASSAVPALKRYDATSNAWTNLASMPTPRTQGAMVAYSGKLYYLGGYDAGGGSPTSIYVYDIAAGTWSTSPIASPIDLSRISASIVGSTVYFAGGSGNRTVYQINLATGSTAGAKTTPTDHGDFPGMVSIGTALYLISGGGVGTIDRLDTTSGLTAYQANLALLKALVAA